MDIVSGHCFCNAVRFEVGGPEKFACFCYCESCQRIAGAPVVAWASYEKQSFRVTRGEIRFYQSSPGVTRGQCADCGSSISYENIKRPGDIDLTSTTLDDPGGPTPRAHIWTQNKPSWMFIGDDLPGYEKNVG